MQQNYTQHPYRKYGKYTQPVYAGYVVNHDVYDVTRVIRHLITAYNFYSGRRWDTIGMCVCVWEMRV